MSYSTPRLVTSVLLQGSMLGPVMFKQLAVVWMRQWSACSSSLETTSK